MPIGAHGAGTAALLGTAVTSAIQVVLAARHNPRDRRRATRRRGPTIGTIATRLRGAEAEPSTRFALPPRCPVDVIPGLLLPALRTDIFDVSILASLDAKVDRLAGDLL
jgi:hypothetical protein